MNRKSKDTLTFVADAPRHLFFTGKGGVGKTSLACASALALAEAGKRVLLVSTDPASNLQHVFETEIGQRKPTPVPGADNLFALNIDPESAAQAYRDRVVGPVRGVLPEASVREMEEQLSGACTTEIAAFDEFTMLLTDPATTEGFDHVVFDTDPAAHVTETVATYVERLNVSRIDPAAETERYRQHVLETKGKDLDESERRLLEEDLRSPCTEEIAVFQAFSKAIREASRQFVVMDTAPTGHTLLLLDATGSYHRDIMRHQPEGTSHLVTPMMRLQDPKQTKMLLATLPETTPVLEAQALQEDLRRAGIEPWAWVVNASLAAAGPSDPLLLARARSEVEQIEKVQGGLAQRTALVPWLAEEPTGPENLGKMFVIAGQKAREECK